MHKTVKLIVFGFCSLFMACDINDNPQDLEDSGQSEKLLLLDSLTQLYKEGYGEKSLIGLKSYVERYPDETYAYSMLSTIYLAKNEDSLAKVSVKRALKLNKTNPSALLNRGILLNREGKFDSASFYFSEAIRVKPDYAQAYSNFMGNRIAVNDLAAAKKYGEKAVAYANQPGDKGVLCAVYHKLGLFSKRDSLYRELKHVGYQNLNSLEDVIYTDDE
jgi:Tfp pilus assembly protein PilF